MKIALYKESRAGETRVALTPDAVKSLVTDGWEVVVQRGAGDRSHFNDATYEAVGATVTDAIITRMDVHIIPTLAPTIPTHAPIIPTHALIIRMRGPITQMAVLITLTTPLRMKILTTHTRRPIPLMNMHLMRARQPKPTWATTVSPQPN